MGRAGTCHIHGAAAHKQHRVPPAGRPAVLALQAASGAAAGSPPAPASLVPRLQVHALTSQPGAVCPMPSPSKSRFCSMMLHTPADHACQVTTSAGCTEHIGAFARRTANKTSSVVAHLLGSLQSWAVLAIQLAARSPGSTSASCAMSSSARCWRQACGSTHKVQARPVLVLTCLSAGAAMPASSSWEPAGALWPQRRACSCPGTRLQVPQAWTGLLRTMCGCSQPRLPVRSCLCSWCAQHRARPGAGMQ